MWISWRLFLSVKERQKIRVKIIMRKPYYIIGGGIIGTAIAREIRRRDLGDVLVLEKEDRLGMHASGRNSGVIHSGINQKPNTLKADICVKGSKMLRDYCEGYSGLYKKCGTIVTASNDGDKSRLKRLLENGLACGVKGLRIMGREELLEKEPNASGDEAIFSPDGAIVDSEMLLISMASEARSLGAEYILGCEVFGVRDNRLLTNKGVFEFGHAVNCAGLYADEIARFFNLETAKNLKVIPFKGDYKQVDININSMIYHPPQHTEFPFLGVHLTKTIDGRVLAGPTSTLSWRGRESYDGEYNLKEMGEILFSRNFRRLVKNKEFRKLAWENAQISYNNRRFIKEINTLLNFSIEKREVKHYMSGIRAQMVSREGKMVNDFLIEQAKDSTHILNAVSPGMTCCLAFAEYVVENYVK